MMIYWNCPYGSTTVGESFDAEKRYSFAYFSDQTASTPGYNAKFMHTFDDVSSWIYEMSSTTLGPYWNSTCLSSKFNKPTIDNHLAGYPRYSRYNNQANDTYGRYFPVRKLEPPYDPMARVQVSVDNVVYNIKARDTTTLRDGTY